jgi:SOS-response transcriptional repressor LexA
MMNTETAMTMSSNPVAEILEALMSKHRLNQTELANRSGVSQPAINRILKERSKAKHPRKETLQKIASVLGVTPDQLTGQEVISTRMLAKGVVPVLSWESLAPPNSQGGRKHNAWLACPVEHSDESFALPVLGEAMIGDDGYHEGEIIFLDPRVAPAHGKDVVVLKGKTALFRRLTVTPEGSFLKTLNPSWPTPIMPLPDDAVVCGTVVFSGRIR